MTFSTTSLRRAAAKLPVAIDRYWPMTVMPAQAGPGPKADVAAAYVRMPNRVVAIILIFVVLFTDGVCSTRMSMR